MFCTNIENADVINTVNNCKNNTASGFDRMTITLLKYIVDIIINPLVYFYDLSIEQSIISRLS